MGTDRFMPIRAGIIGIWDYHEQIFRFADGRLVLRGANGSGKTKALEVLVPFVLDGSIDARRLDPFSSQQRTMRSNLLFGEHKVGHGYCWLEFAKGEQTVTVGVGMRAQDRRSSVDRWFFVTDGVVGEDFRLLTDNRIPVTRGAGSLSGASITWLRWTGDSSGSAWNATRPCSSWCSRSGGLSSPKIWIPTRSPTSCPMVSERWITSCYGPALRPSTTSSLPSDS